MTDEQIDACLKSTDWASDCDACPARARCDELVRAEYAQEFGLTPPERAGE